MVNISALKWGAYFLNLIVSIAGLILLCLGARCLFDPTVYPIIVQADVNYTHLYVVVLFGALLTIIGLLGYIGVVKMSTCLIIMFFVLILMIVIGQIAFGVILYRRRIGFSDTIKQSVSVAIAGKQPDKTELFREVERSMKCCGSFSFQSWAASAENIAYLESIASDLIGQGVFFVPNSCCVNRGSHECSLITNRGVAKDTLAVPTEYYRQGCSEKIAYAVTVYVYFVLIYGAISIIVQLTAAFVTLAFMVIYQRSNALGGGKLARSQSMCSVCSARSSHHSIASRSRSLSRLNFEMDHPSEHPMSAGSSSRLNVAGESSSAPEPISTAI